MKSKFSRILGVGLVIAVLVSTFVVASPVSAGNMGWTKDTKPSTSAGTDVLDVVAAANGSTGYAVVSGDVYKTTSGGTSWTKLTNFTAGGATNVAVASDVADGSFLAVIANGSQVWVSTNGGTTFSQMTGYAATTIRSVSISPAVGLSRSVAIAADNATWVFTSSPDFGAGSTWTNIMASGNVTAGPALAVAYSPNYVQDRTLVVISTDGANTRMNLYNAATMLWNADYAVYGVPDKGTVITATPAGYADVDLPSSFMAFDSTLRIAYIASNIGLYRNTTQLSPTAMVSVAVNAAGDKLVAGSDSGNKVYRVASPATATSTAVLSNSTTKAPGYTTSYHVMVEFFGASVVAGTSGPESAVSVSADDGKSFNDVALIDTTATVMDFAVSSDGSKYYLVTENAGVTSLWRKTTAWERVYKVAGTGYIVRPAADNFDVVFLAETGTANLWYSNDAGQTTWQPRVAYNAITDFAAESSSAMYALNGAFVSKAVDGGYLWDNPKKDPGVGTLTSITLVAKDNVLVSGATGFAYTTDGGNNWTKVSSSAVGAVSYAVADKLSSGGKVTASVGASVYQFTIGTDTTFPTTAKKTGVGNVSGMVINGGVVYGQTADATPNTSTLRSPVSSTSWSTIALSGTHLDMIKAGGANLYSLATAGTDVGNIFIFTEIFAAAKPVQKLPADKFDVQMNIQTGGANDVVFQWDAIADSPTGTTYLLEVSLDSGFTQVVKSVAGTTKKILILGPTGIDGVVNYQGDTTYYWRVRVDGNTNGSTYDSQWSATRSFKIGPLAPFSIVAPAPGGTNVSVTPTFVWTKVQGATTYEIIVSDDPTFKIITFSRTTTMPEFASDEQLAYSTVYYWRVRASAPATAVTSYLDSIFTTEAKPVAPTTAPPPVTITSVPPPTITVSIPPATEAIPAYLLWIIIGIGAILVIALIVLIVRTRRTG